MGDEGQAPGSTGKCRDINNVLLGLSDKGYARELAVGSRRVELATLAQEGWRQAGKSITTEKAESRERSDLGFLVSL